MIAGTVILEPELEFGTGARHVEQRAGVELFGPADVAMPDRKSEMRIGIVGPADATAELAKWLEVTAQKGVPAKATKLETLFPAFPGCSNSTGFLTTVELPAEGRRPLTRKRLELLNRATDGPDRVEAAVALCAEEVANLHDRALVDVVMVIRPDGVPAGVPKGGQVGADFHDLLKARLISTPQPIQIIRPSTWRGGKGVEDQATCAWNLFTALYYKAGGKPWRLVRSDRELTRCYVGVSFTRTAEDSELMASVAQVFNELGDGVIVRGGLARRSGADRQPHLSQTDARQLLDSALDRYKEEHRTLPAAITLHKTSAFSAAEIDGFLQARDDRDLHECELIWVTNSDDAHMVRPSQYHPPMRGTLLSLSAREHVLYANGSVPYYRTYPGMYVPRPLGLRPALTERPIEQIAAETLALTKLNWNRARLNGKRPITLLTADRVGDILRHVPDHVRPAPRYANYM